MRKKKWTYPQKNAFEFHPPESDEEEQVHEEPEETLHCTDDEVPDDETTIPLGLQLLCISCRLFLHSPAGWQPQLKRGRARGLPDPPFRPAPTPPERWTAEKLFRLLPSCLSWTGPPRQAAKLLPIVQLPRKSSVRRAEAKGFGWREREAKGQG